MVKIRTLFDEAEAFNDRIKLIETERDQAHAKLARVTAERDEIQKSQDSALEYIRGLETTVKKAEAKRDALLSKVREYEAELSAIGKAYRNAGGAEFSEMQRGADVAVERCQIEFRSLFGLGGGNEG